jgi:hypothetical protein
MVAGCGHPPPSAQDPESAANAFFASLEQGNPHAAYDSAAFGFQAAQTFEAFFSNARELGLVGGQLPVWTGSDGQGTEARLDGTVVSQSGTPVNVSVTLTPDGGAWKVFSLHTATGQQDAEPEDRFTLVGKGTGFNDVYHQPMPGPEELARLVNGTMAKFNTAIRTGDFHAFYGSVSQQWKDGQRMTGEAAAGVTENMLKHHFQDFIDKKIDLSPLAGAPPVFDPPPLINQDGLLDLYGHIDGPQFRVNFFLEYAYELPRWKLFGINLSITK